MLDAQNNNIKILELVARMSKLFAVLSSWLYILIILMIHHYLQLATARMTTDWQ